MDWLDSIGVEGSLWSVFLSTADNRAPWLQAIVIAVCLLIAAVAARAWVGRARRARGGPRSELEVDALTTVRRPHIAIIALILLAVARPIVEIWEPAGLLRLAVVFAAALSIIRVSVQIAWRLLPNRILKASLRWVGLLVWIGVVLYVTGYLDVLIAMLEGTGFQVGRHSISLWEIIGGAFWVGLTMLGAIWASTLMEQRLLGAEALDVNLRVVLARVLRAVLLLVALLIGVSLVGLDITALSVFGGALGVGLGLGLQRIASNYVSGFIILLERSLRPGDMVRVAQTYGRVTEIRTRFTVIRALNGVHFIVPNEALTSDTVQNVSTNGAARVSVTVQVAYGSDPDLVQRLMCEAAAANPRVLTDPGPSAFLTGFGADGLDFELGMFVPDPENGMMAVQSSVSVALLRSFEKHGIQIPYPQREVRMLGGALPAAGEPVNAK